ncbi:hypothetical protein [Usitatibacter palustris]|uniref:Uncharacterized protein n=1 Tax=Usitatibacter palustris TaxID=2732487 RepID=A0A6M4HAC1_9PROT|nr:hypothetical protein [Usitatibacter palustris]QJR16749.1 hypothetical protein DSM104440_03585 [Usitatibacter palustris]
MKRALLAVLVLAFAVAAPAQESRSFNPIARPAAPSATPEGAVRISPPIPVPRDRVEGVVNSIANAWTARRLQSMLAASFPNRDQLSDALVSAQQKDARLRVTAIQGWQVIDQYRQGGRIVSKLNVTVRTQVEFNDATGFQRRDGTNEWVVTIRGRGDQP